MKFVGVVFLALIGASLGAKLDNLLGHGHAHDDHHERPSFRWVSNNGITYTIEYVQGADGLKPVIRQEGSNIDINISEFASLSGPADSQLSGLYGLPQQTGSGGSTSVSSQSLSQTSGGGSTHISGGGSTHFSSGGSVQTTSGGSTHISSGGSSHISGGSGISSLSSSSVGGTHGVGGTDSVAVLLAGQGLPAGVKRAQITFPSSAGGVSSSQGGQTSKLTTSSKTVTSGGLSVSHASSGGLSSSIASNTGLASISGGGSSHGNIQSTSHTITGGSTLVRGGGSSHFSAGGSTHSSGGVSTTKTKGSSLSGAKFSAISSSSIGGTRGVGGADSVAVLLAGQGLPAGVKRAQITFPSSAGGVSSIQGSSIGGQTSKLTTSSKTTTGGGLSVSHASSGGLSSSVVSNTGLASISGGGSLSNSLGTHKVTSLNTNIIGSAKKSTSLNVNLRKTGSTSSTGDADSVAVILSGQSLPPGVKRAQLSTVTSGGQGISSHSGNSAQFISGGGQRAVIQSSHVSGGGAQITSGNIVNSKTTATTGNLKTTGGSATLITGSRTNIGDADSLAVILSGQSLPSGVRKGQIVSSNRATVSHGSGISSHASSGGVSTSNFVSSSKSGAFGTSGLGASGIGISSGDNNNILRGTVTSTSSKAQNLRTTGVGAVSGADGITVILAGQNIPDGIKRGSITSSAHSGGATHGATASKSTSTLSTGFSGTNSFSNQHSTSFEQSGGAVGFVSNSLGLDSHGLGFGGSSGSLTGGAVSGFTTQHKANTRTDITASKGSVKGVPVILSGQAIPSGVKKVTLKLPVVSHTSGSSSFHSGGSQSTGIVKTGVFSHGNTFNTKTSSGINSLGGSSLTSGGFSGNLGSSGGTLLISTAGGVGGNRLGGDVHQFKSGIRQKVTQIKSGHKSRKPIPDAESVAVLLAKPGQL